MHHRLIEVSGSFDLGRLPWSPFEDLLKPYERVHHAACDVRVEAEDAEPGPAWLLRLGRYGLSEEVQALIVRLGYRPPLVRHLAAFGILFPRVVALAQVVVAIPPGRKPYGNERAEGTSPVLDLAAYLGPGRALSVVRLHDKDRGWSKECSFLAIGREPRILASA